MASRTARDLRPRAAARRRGAQSRLSRSPQAVSVRPRRDDHRVGGRARSAGGRDVARAGGRAAAAPGSRDGLAASRAARWSGCAGSTTCRAASRRSSRDGRARRPDRGGIVARRRVAADARDPRFPRRRQAVRVGRRTPFRASRAPTATSALRTTWRSISPACDFLAVPLEEVKASFARFGCERGVEFVPGFFEDTLPGLTGRRWSIVRLDGDTYDATRLALRLAVPGLAPGGYLIVDDYLPLDQCRRGGRRFPSRARHRRADRGGRLERRALAPSCRCGPDRRRDETDRRRPAAGAGRRPAPSRGARGWRGCLRSRRSSWARSFERSRRGWRRRGRDRRGSRSPRCEARGAGCAAASGSPSG